MEESFGRFGNVPAHYYIWIPNPLQVLILNILARRKAWIDTRKIGAIGGEEFRIAGCYKQA
jgi:hypothetical protein